MRTGHMRTGPAQHAQRLAIPTTPSQPISLPYMSHRAIRRPMSELSVVQRLETTLCASNVPTPREGIATPGRCECQGRRTCCDRVSLSVPLKRPDPRAGITSLAITTAAFLQLLRHHFPIGAVQREGQGVAPKRDSCPPGSLISVAISCYSTVSFQSYTTACLINIRSI